MKIPFNDLTRIHDPLRPQIIDIVDKILGNSAFIGGKEVERFEELFGQYCGIGSSLNVASVSNGTDGLELILRAMEIGEGNEVITVANTFYATASSIQAAGARPVLVDIDPQTQLMDVNLLQEKINPKTRAIMPVHLYGQQADMKSIRDIADRNNLRVIEDAAQAHGSLQNGHAPGHFGDAAVFSFYPGKNLGALGDAGAVISNDKELVRQVKRLREYGQTRKYEHDELGFNHRMDSMQASFLSAKLPFLDSWNEDRRRFAEEYSTRLSSIDGLKLPTTADGNTHTYHLYVIRTEERNALQEFLNQKGIQTGIHYPVPIHEQKAFAYLGARKGDYPHSEESARQSLSLPIFPKMNNKEVDYVISNVGDFFSKSL